MSVAAESGTASGSGSTSRRAFSAGTRISSARPPGSMRRGAEPRAQRVAPGPAEGARSCTARGGARTPARPAAMRGAPGPAAITSPAGSCPRTIGARGSWYQSMRSLPQRPQARTRTTSSPGPATGSGAVLEPRCDPARGRPRPARPQATGRVGDPAGGVSPAGHRDDGELEWATTRARTTIAPASPPSATPEARARGRTRRRREPRQGHEDPERDRRAGDQGPGRLRPGGRRDDPRRPRAADRKEPRAR